MAEHFGEYCAPQFTGQIEANMRVAAAPTVGFELTAGQARATIRTRGAYLTGLVLEGYAGEVDVLHSEPNLAVPKLEASHGMLPVGPYEGVGSRHGFPRWADYDIEAMSNNSPDFGLAVLRAETRDLPVDYSRTFVLSPDRLQITTGLQNNRLHGISTSMGEHLYFALPKGASVGDVRLNNDTIDSALGRGATERVQDGLAQFWAAFPGKVSVTMPDDRVLIVNASATLGREAVPQDELGMLVWQRPGESFVCLEPTLGFNPAGPRHNTGLYIPDRVSSTMTSTMMAGRAALTTAIIAA